MCFMFYILIVINLVCHSSNYVLKRINPNEDGALKLDNDHVILQENLTNTRSPNLKVNIFDQKLSDEMLSLKQSLYGTENTAKHKFKSTKNNIGTPTIDINQKWPAVGLLSKQHESEEDEEEVDDFDFKHLFSEESDNALLSTELPSSVISPDKVVEHIELEDKVKNVDVIEEQNQSKDKIFDLRSLGHVPSNMYFQRQNVSNHCPCTRNLIDPNWAQGYVTIPYTNPDIYSNNCGGCFKTTISYTLMPYYIPAEPYYYPPYSYVITEEPKKGDETYYNDDGGKERKFESDSESDDDYHEKNKSKKKKKPKSVKEDIIVDIDYDLKPRETKVNWDTVFLEGSPKKLVNDLVDDLMMLYPDSTIRKCYCSASSNYSYVSFSYVFLFLFELII